MLLRLIESLGPPLLRLIGSTFRVKILPEGVDAERERSGQRVIFCFWHGRMLVPAYTHRFRKITIMISRHRDGEFIERVVRRLGFGSVRGSTTRGGEAGLKAILRAARAGRDLAFTPDGPRGPRYKVQKGVVFAASRTGLPVVPAAVEVSKGWVLGSWDEFTIPKPFATVVILQGNQIHIPPGIGSDEIDEHCRALEEEIHRLTHRAKKIACETTRTPKR